MSSLLLQLPGIRPIHATIGTIIFAAAMFAALALGGPRGLIAGGLLFQAASVFDGVDGEIARASFRTSQAGATLDTIVDAATNLLFVLGVTINLAVQGEPLAAMVGGWGFGLFAIGLALLARPARRGPGPFTLDQLKLRGASSLLVAAFFRFLTIVSSRDFFALLFALLILAGTPMAVLYIFAAAATIWFPLVVATSIGTRAPATVSARR